MPVAPLCRHAQHRLVASRSSRGRTITWASAPKLLHNVSACHLISVLVYSKCPTATLLAKGHSRALCSLCDMCSVLWLRACSSHTTFPIPIPSELCVCCKSWLKNTSLSSTGTATQFRNSIVSPSSHLSGQSTGSFMAPNPLEDLRQW